MIVVQMKHVYLNLKSIAVQYRVDIERSKMKKGLCFFGLASLMFCNQLTIAERYSKSANNDYSDEIRRHNEEIEKMKEEIDNLKSKFEAFEQKNINNSNEKTDGDIVEISIEGKTDQEIANQIELLLDENEPVQARKMAEAVLKARGQSIYKGMMLFFIGESFYQEKTYQDAALQYMQSFKENSKGVKTPECLFKLGLSLEKLGRISEAKAMFEKLKSDYSGEFANKAIEKLRTLK